MQIFPSRLYKNVFFTILLAFFIGLTTSSVIFFLVWHDRIWPSFDGENDREIRSGENDLINPLLECSYSNNTELRPFEKELQTRVDEEKQNGAITNISVVFRDLLSGARVDIYPEEEYIPASLLKVPIMMAYYKAAEKDPTLLQKKIQYDEDKRPSYIENNTQSRLQVGSSYTVENLIEEMIVNSDNTAVSLLSSLKEAIAYYDKLNEELGINLSEANQEKDYLGVVKYSSFFRILYNSSYLSPEMSNKALNLLTKTTFKKALNKNLPKEIKVGHKYGTRYLENSLVELHDCGIVYYPKRPYLLCVMTKGKSTEALEESIWRISEEVYRKVLGSTK